MNLYETKLKSCAILFASVLVVSCGGASDGQSQANSGGSDSVVTRVLGPVVALSSELVNMSVGETVTLDITMTDFPVSEGGGVTVRFDPSMLNVSSVVINSGVWNFVSKVGAIDNDSGVVTDILFSSFKGVSGNTMVAAISFDAVASGSSQINLEGSAINPFSSGGGKVAVSFIPTSIHVSAAAN